MALPLQLQLFDAMLGTQEGIHPIILPDIFSSGGSRNVWMDKYARVKRILGYTAQGSAVTTDTGASATLIRNLIPYRITSGGGAFTRQVLGVFDDGSDEWELWFSTNEGVTWTFIADLGAGSVGAIADSEQFGDLLILTNGVMTPRIWNGTTLSVAGGTQLAKPTVSASGTGPKSGSYLYKIAPRLDTGARKIASVTSDAISLEGQGTLLGWTADADTNVVGYEIYSTTGTGKVFYFVDYVDERTTVAYTDTSEDLQILENRVLEEHGDAPPSGAHHVVVHKQRAWYLRTDAFPQRAFYSDAGLESSVFDENRIDFQDAESMGDVITGGVGNYEGTLVVFQERSIWTVSGTGQIIGNIVDWNRTRTNAQAGSVSRRSIVRIPAGSRYLDQTGRTQTTATVTLAYFTPMPDIRLFDGDNDLLISHPVSASLRELNYAQRRKVHALHDDQRSEVTWFYPRTNAGECDYAVTWNYRWGVWYEREWAFASAVHLESSTVSDVHLGGSNSTATSGLTFLLWDGNDFNGTAFTAQVMTKTFYGMNEQGQPIPTFRKRWRWVDVLFETDESVEILVEWLNGNTPDDASAVNGRTITPGTSLILTADGDGILTDDDDAIAVSLSTSQVKIGLNSDDGQYLHDEGIRLRIGDNQSLGSWSLEAYTLAYQILPGLSRRQFTEGS